ncbi:hypothetical protein FA15DRAFT_645475 [Coprinopsis marcescibilis]|uniref:Structural maintenance of chromosomes protein 4 n=1 Tax=Coprinopsis marcescibilis TaxID=230819 RepID=A0A5C3KMS8_COPMA|nr:hypothetical protein FA15DRAFT_645475 [Coprinopsis marcescibilis]
MPPRRSSRAPSIAVEQPTEATEGLPAKRKRGQASSSKPESSVGAKPASRARGSRASAVPAPAAKGRTSKTRSSLPEVAESDDEEEEDVAPPARKKSRPSVESESMKEEDGDDAEEVSEAVEEEEEELPPSKGKRRATSSKKKVNDMEVDEPAELPKRRGSRQISSTATRKPSSSARPARKSRVTSVADPVPEEDQDEEEEPKPTKRSRRDTGKAKVKEEPVSDAEPEVEQQEDDEEVDYEEPIASKGRRGKGKAPAKQAPKVGKRLPTVVVATDSEDEGSAPPVSKKQAKASSSKEKEKSPKKEEPEEEEEEEEEKSLFEPIPIPDPASLPQSAPEEPQGPKPRLVISKIALVNFKSYAGRQEIGPFHKSFSAIVGPNGSGKSNTIDALLFVFGYRASKMRQGKVSELIHNSAAYPDLEECSVEVHFRDILDLPGPDSYKVIPGSKLVVARTAFKNNLSKYTINGKVATFKEVQALLKGRGIDLDHNRFLILQGEVESIAQMKPKAQTEHDEGLLEYLEDIIGTAELKKPIEEALVEMEHLQEERQGKLNKLRLVEKEKMALEEQRREAINFIKMKNDHIRALSRYYQWVIDQMYGHAAIKEKQRAVYEKQLAAEAEKHEEELKYVEDLRIHYTKKEQAYKIVKSELEILQKKQRDQEKLAVGAKERQKHGKSRKKKLEKSVHEDTSGLKAAQQAIKDGEAKLAQEKSNLDKHERELIEAEAALEEIQESLRGKTDVFNKQIQQKQKELQPWTAKINEKTAELNVAQSERDELVRKAQALETSVKDAEDALQGLENEQQEKLADQSGCKSEKDTLKRKLATATAKQQAAQKDINDWRGKATSLRGRLEEAKASQSANRSRNALLEGLNNLKRQGRLDGFHGKLGDLGTIPDKYDVAISTAAGGSLSNMVVEKVEQGKACIDHLRKNNMGRASFMVLDKLKDSHGMNPVQTPEGVSRLFDLVKPKDPMYRKAFYKAMGDTLVVNDMEQANRIAYNTPGKKWRVVTLAGQLIEMSGAMSGGGNQPSRGAMNSKLSVNISPDTLREYENDSEKAAFNLNKALKEAQEADMEVEQLQKAGPELDLRYQKLTIEIETRKARIKEATKRAQDLRAQNKPNAGDTARIKQLESQITSITAALEKIQREADKILGAIKELEQEILKIGGAKLMTQKSRVEGIRNYISLTNDAISKAEHDKNKGVNDVKRLTASVEANSKQLAEVTEELETLNEEADRAEIELQGLLQEIEEGQTALETEKDAFDQAEADLKEVEDGLAKYNKKKLELEQRIADATKEIKEKEDVIDGFQTSHDKLELHDIEEEEEDDSDDEEDEGGDSNKGEAGDEEMKQDQEEGRSSSKKKAELTLKIYTSEELQNYRQAELLADTELLDEKIKNSKADTSVLREYKKKQAIFDNRAKDVEEATKARDEMKDKYDGLRKQRLDNFMSGFNTISLKLKEMYQMITLGGNAELELVDSMDPFSEGIIFSVMPPKKSWKNISNLSGGEKTLSSLALVFALHVFKPTPLYFMDEIDAALDFRNVSIVANYIKDRTKNAQFIIISLRNDMFELSHKLIGIYKTSNATRSISIKNHRLLTTMPHFMDMVNSGGNGNANDNANGVAATTAPA